LSKYSVNINGKSVPADDSLSMRLLDFIRDVAGFKGTKEGCAEGECGACTVLVNGDTVDSCLVLVGQVVGKEVTTVEGLKNGAEGMHPIQKAYVEAGAIQCGFCTPGMVLSTKALLDKNPNPTEEEIRVGISGNLCRCTGYTKIVEAVRIASGEVKK